MNNRVIPLHLVDFRNFYLDIVLFFNFPRSISLCIF